MTERAEIAAETLADLEAVDLERGRPLIAVDADEVLVIFVDHLRRFLRTLGVEMRLQRYELEGSMFPIGSDEALPFAECIALIGRFFEDQTLHQDAVPGAAAALDRLAQHAQIVVLTNVPRHAGPARRSNLQRLGIPFPVVVNSGGKGRAMAWLASHVQAPTAFIDDSVNQIESVAKHAPGTLRLHFAWADFIHRLFPDCVHATAQVRDWRAAQTLLRRHLAQAA